MPQLSFRVLALLAFAAPVLAMLFALYLQYGLHLEPCAMCVFQRVAMIALAVVWLLAALQAPRGAGRWVYAGLGTLAAGTGAGIAARHVWLQNLPPDQVPACGPALNYMLDVFPLQEVIATVLRGDGNCAIIDAQFLGLSIPGWTLIAFVGLAVMSLALPLFASREEPA